MTSNGIERQPPLTTTEYQGRTGRVYTIDTVYSGRSGFVEVPEFKFLVNEVKDLYLEIYPNRNKEMSTERVMRMLSHPRTYLMLARYEGIPAGFGVCPRLYIEGDYAMYSSRGFVENHEREGLGVYVLDRAIELHDRDLARSLRFGVLMTQNPASVVSLARTPRAKDIKPFRSIGLGGRYQHGSKEQAIMLAIHNIFRTRSLGVNTTTGVIKGELWDVGPNENYSPDRNSSTWPIYQEMVGPGPEGLEMNREAGDLVIVTYAINPAA